MKGADGLCLVFQGGIAGEGLDGEGGQVRLVYLVCVEGLGDGVGDHHPPEDLAEGHAQVLTQDSGDSGSNRDLVAGGDFLHQTVVQDLGGQGEDQVAGVEAGEGLLQAPVGGSQGGLDPGIFQKRRFYHGIHVFGKDNGIAHIHCQDFLTVHMGGEKSLEC